MANRAMMERDMASAPQRTPAHPRLVLAFALIDRAVGHGADDRVVDAVKDADKERQKRDGSGGNSHLVCQEHPPERR